MKKLLILILLAYLLSTPSLIFGESRQAEIDLSDYVLNDTTKREILEIFYKKNEGRRDYVDEYDYYLDSEAFVIWYLADHGYYNSALTQARQKYVDPHNIASDSLEWEWLANYGFVEKLNKPKVGAIGIAKAGKLHIIEAVNGDKIRTVHYTDSEDFDRVEADYRHLDFICYIDFLNAFDWYYHTSDNGHQRGYSILKKPYITGDENGELHPEKLVTRAEFMTILNRVNCIEVPPSDGAAKYPDIAGHWAYHIIQAGSEMALLEGYPDGKFHPDDVVTASQAAAIIRRNWQRLGAFDYFNSQTLPDDNRIISETETIQGRLAKKRNLAFHWLQFSDDPLRSDIPISRGHWAYRDIFATFPLFSESEMLDDKWLKVDPDGDNQFDYLIDIDQPLNREQVALLFNHLTGRGLMGLDLGSDSLNYVRAQQFGHHIQLANYDITDIKSYKMDQTEFYDRALFNASSLPRQ